MAEMRPDQGPTAARIEPLLADANRLRAKGELETAETRCREALAQAPGNAEAHELLGDVLYQRRRGEEALEHYRLARAANPQRRMLEDKVGRASLLVAEAEIMRARAEDLLAGKRNRTPRKPGASALLSLVVPGFGQIYNGEHVKGALIACAWLMLLMGAFGDALASFRQGGAGRAAAGAFDAAAIVTVFFTRPTLWWTLVMMTLGLYSIADAALQAAKSVTAPGDLV